MQLTHSWKNRQESVGISISSVKPHSGHVSLALVVTSIWLSPFVNFQSGDSYRALEQPADGQPVKDDVCTGHHHQPTADGLDVGKDQAPPPKITG